MSIIKDENGFICYVNLYDVMELPDMFASNVKGWLKMDIDPWNKTGSVDSEWYPIQADNAEQLEARKDMLHDGVGTTPGIRTHNRRILHTDE